LNIEVEDFALWHGYALTQADALALRDRTSTPAQVGAGLAWWVSLDGAAGATVTNGDAGLANQGSTGAADNLTGATSTTTYSGSPLVYVTPSRLRAALLMPSGKAAGFVFEDVTGAIQNVQSINGTPTVRRNGGSAQSLVNPIWGLSGTTAQPWILW